MDKFTIPFGTSQQRALEMFEAEINRLRERLELLERERKLVRAMNQKTVCTCDADYTGIHRRGCSLVGTAV